MKKTLQTLLLACIVAGGAAPAWAQTLDPTFAAATGVYAPGTVYSTFTQADGRHIVNGVFIRANGTPVSSLVRVEASGALDQAFAQNVGVTSNVFKSRQLANGQYLLISGNHSLSAAGLSRYELLRLNSNGTGDPGFDIGAGASIGGTEGFVDDVDVQADGKILVLGWFDTFSGSPANFITRLNADGTRDTGFNPGLGASDEVFSATTLPDGKILAAGFFELFDGHTCNGLVRLNANGSYDPTFVSPLQPGSMVSHVVRQPDGKLLLNGDLYLTSGSATGQGLARLNADGSLDNTFAPSGFPVGSVGFYYYNNGPKLQPDGKIIVTGSLGFAPGEGGNTIVRLNADGSRDASFQVGAGANAQILSVDVLPNGGVLAAGTFSVFSTRDDSPLVRLTATGALDPTFTTTLQTTGNVLAMVQQADGKTVLGGTISEFNGQRVHRLARLNADGTLDAAFAANTGIWPGSVSTLALQADGKIIAGGGPQVMRYTTTGTPDVTFTAARMVPGGVSRLALQADGKVVVGGTYTSVNGVSTKPLVRLTTTGALDASFAPALPTGFTNIARTAALLVQPDGKIVASTWLRPTLSTTQENHLVRYLSTGAIDNSFDNTAAIKFNSSVGQAIALVQQPDGALLVGGDFTSYGGVLRNQLARVTSAGALDLTYVPAAQPASSSITSLAIQPNGRVLVGGVTASTGLLKRVLASGQTDATFGTTAQPNGRVSALLVQPNGASMLGGAFTTVAGQANATVARITAPNVLHVAAPAAVAARTAVWPVPAHSVLHVLPDAAAHPLSVELLDALGRPVAQRTAVTAELGFTVADLAAGLYTVRVNYAEGVVVRRVVVK
ncbi:T9SS type A sorting domain-containing protein [Hymenobacter persicinus]|uniref:T9SS type A sorting domain-containing protein n=1 Tax=Hymenobacter persicinus TaxID=2025506 RepID=A0A4V1ZAN7_9BACT|nr:T9SS type A sorting domain-containing protein [Hymenobacter persicinus]RYU78954.1 T9SS type A sorting domain-containing protein [Hymenobacter persicinus]